MPGDKTRTTRIEARTAPDAPAVAAAAQEPANRTIEEAQIIRLSVEDQLRFAEALLNPLKESPALSLAREAHSRLIRQTR